MERIVLEVDSSLAKAWKNSSAASRAVYEKKIVAVLKEFQDAELDEDSFTKAQRDFLAKEAAKDTERYEWWNDEEMMAELDKIEADLKSGKDPGISWDELKKDLLSHRKKDAI
ncbi:MAG TPA: hypothetical protein VHE59_07425 [Mucilaginibacter sp.]|nr:hypothetical protein [Mucilaginibacter sp.]